jgi:hypothetical protein
VCGHIEIKSKEGSGTKVTVQIPAEIQTSSLAPTRAIDNSIHLTVCQQMKGLKVCMISSEISTKGGKEGVPEVCDTDAASTLSMRKSLRKTLKYWFEMEIVEAPSIDSADADVYLLLTDELSTTGDQIKTNSYLRSPEVSLLAEANALMVLCTAPASTKASELQEAGRLIQQP